ncbi:SGNH/GDSL hydrolase family protein, partial [bacterium]|nr:SGNH/GDSL hydrolase family protein [bacterium]
MSATPSRPPSALLVALIGIILAVPLVEVAARALHLAPPVRVIDVTHDDTVYMRSENPILGFELKPNWSDPDADCLRSYPSTNSHGQRDVERTLAKPPGKERILLLGASVVEGVGLKDLDDTISRQLERMLGGAAEVLNFGVSAYCTRAKVELLHVKGLAFDPDVVVLFVSENDFRNFNFEAFELAPRVSRPPGADWLYERSHAFRALALRANWFQYAAQNDPEAWNHGAIGDNNVVDGIAVFAELAREHGFDPIVAIWPQFRDDAIVDTDPAPGIEDRLLFEAIASMAGVPSFRFSPYFRAEWERHPDANPRVRYTIGD